MKSKRIINKELCKKYTSYNCLICGGNNLVSGHHIMSKGSGGHDIEWNLMPLCFNHHTEVHVCGLVKFSLLYDLVKVFLDKNNWELCELTNKWRHYG